MENESGWRGDDKPSSVWAWLAGSGSAGGSWQGAVVKSCAGDQVTLVAHQGAVGRRQLGLSGGGSGDPEETFAVVAGAAGPRGR